MMHHRILAFVSLFSLLALLAMALPAETSISASTQDRSTDDVRSNPVMFIENAGQWDDDARFQVWGGPAGTMWLADDAIWLTVVSPTSPPAPPFAGEGSEGDATRRSLPENGEAAASSRGVAIKLSFVGANPQPRIETYNRLDTLVSYFLGDDQAEWRPDVPVWGGVRYVDLYPGVDLELSAENGQMTPRLVARLGADLGAVRLRVEGVDAVTVDGDALRLSAASDEYAFPLLQTDGATNEMVVRQRDAHVFDVLAPFVAMNSRLSSPIVNCQLSVANCQSRADHPADLVYSTFLRNTGEVYIDAIAVDGMGSAYVTGYTTSNDFPTTPGAFDPSLSGTQDGLVTKFNPAGSRLIYATFLGGGDRETTLAIAVDGAGSAYMTGWTSSSNFPTTAGAFDRNCNGGYADAFVAKLNPAGSGLVYATCLGGSDSDMGLGIAVNGAGSAYVTGQTTSSNFPTTPGAFDRTLGGGACGWPIPHACPDAFVANLNPAGSALTYASFLGDIGTEWGYGIAVDGLESAYVTGKTNSSDFPTTPGAHDTSYNLGEADAFVVKLNPSGSELAYATFLGDDNLDSAAAIAVDGTRSAYVTGTTWSTNFPTTPGAFDTSSNGREDVFVTKLNSVGSGLVYSTFLGGSYTDSGNGIAVDGAGGVHVTGRTVSSNFPTTPGAFDPVYNGTWDAFAARLNPIGSALAYATFLGGSMVDGGSAISVDGAGNTYVAGGTGSSNFPTTPGAFDTSFNDGWEPYVAKLAMGGAPVPTPTSTPTRTPTATPTSTPTPTATPPGPWAAWRAGSLPLLVPPMGVDVVVDYGNMATPVPLAARVFGATLFSGGTISGTTTISATLPAANGSYALSLVPALGATTGQTLTVHVDVGPVMLTRDGWISQPVYLPLLVRH